MKLRGASALFTALLALVARCSTASADVGLNAYTAKARGARSSAS